MSKWLLRGVVLAALMVIIRLLQGAMIGAWQSEALLISISLVVIFAIVALVWGLLDGQRDARAQVDPDRREDLAMVWLLAGLFAGVISGLVSWIISQFYGDIYTGGLITELTTFAAFTALIVFAIGVFGVTLGRYLVDRKAPPPSRHDHAGERADTDVFAAVSVAVPADTAEGGTEIIETTPEPKPEA
jgi:hypothetical protein